MVSGVIQMLICKTHKSSENQPQQQLRLCRQILLQHTRRLWLRDPWAMRLKLQQIGEGAGESPAPSLKLGLFTYGSTPLQERMQV